MAESLPLQMIIGATGGMGAAVVCHPLDVLRVNMQVQLVPKTTVATLQDILRESGLKCGLYSGLSAAFLRQWTYGACRLGIYTSLLRSSNNKPQEVSFRQKLLYGLTAGGIGSTIGTPAEVALVRMSADARKPLEERRGAGVLRVLGIVVREDGFFSMWRGVAPTVTRAMSLAATTLAVTSETKEQLPQLVPSLAAYPTVTMGAATVVASFWATVASQPFDVVKSRVQNMVIPPGGRPPYSGSLDCFVKTLREGPHALYKGFTPAFVKLVPYNMLSLTIVEKLTLILTGKAAF
mmetsp:Transcript_47987/g.111992  ORF Transcript_47987/g.111992 Transcript_47987/m.111992 type:complete len:293 (+) Transcript_47987:136-1014(+)